MPEDMPEDRYKNLINWVHDYLKSSTIEVVYITDLDKTTIGLKDAKGDSIFLLGSCFDLSYVINDDKAFNVSDRLKHENKSHE